MSYQVSSLSLELKTFRIEKKTSEVLWSVKIAETLRDRGGAFDLLAAFYSISVQVQRDVNT